MSSKRNRMPGLTVGEDPFERGVVHGRAFAADVSHNLDTYLQRFGASGLSIDAAFAEALRWQKAMESQNAEYTKEMRGIAAGSGQKQPENALLTAPCDIPVPSAAGNHLTAQNAPHIQSHPNAEGADGPTTPEADAILEQRGITVVPDILCNAGGVFVSYLEYTQETQQEQMSATEVGMRLEQRMKEKFAQVEATARERKLSLRQAAMLLAVRRVAQALEARGSLP